VTSEWLKNSTHFRGKQCNANLQVQQNIFLHLLSCVCYLFQQLLTSWNSFWSIIMVIYCVLNSLIL